MGRAQLAETIGAFNHLLRAQLCRWSNDDVLEAALASTGAEDVSPALQKRTFHAAEQMLWKGQEARGTLNLYDTATREHVRCLALATELVKVCDPTLAQTIGAKLPTKTTFTRAERASIDEALNEARVAVAKLRSSPLLP